MSDHTPTPQQITDAIEMLSMCEPIKEVQGGMWFGRNFDMADATFVDYGACRAFAVAARALPVLVKRQDALKASLAEMVGIYWGDGDGIDPPPACIQRALAVLASIEETAK